MLVQTEQFIYGKLVGYSNRGYEAIAWSPGLNSQLIRSIYSECEKIRPEFFSPQDFQAFYVGLPLSNERYALIYFNRSLQKETGRNFFLHEHYYIFDKEIVREKGSRLIQFLPQIPLPRVFDKKTAELPQEINLLDPSTTFQDWLAIGNSEIKEQHILQNSLISTIHHLFSSRNVLIVFPPNSPDKQRWIWLNSLTKFLPDSSIRNLSFFVGKTPPSKWHPTLCLVKSRLNTKNYVVFDLAQRGESFLEKSNFIPATYSHLAYESLQNFKLEFIERMKTIISESRSFTTEVEHATTSLDQEYGEMIMPYVGLDLVRIAVYKRDYEIEDVLWLWRYSEEFLRVSDIADFIKILVSEHKDWTTRDFMSLSKALVKNYQEILSVALSLFEKNKYSDPSLLINFLERLEPVLKTASKYMERFFCALVKLLIPINANSFVQIFRTFLISGGRLDSIGDYIEITQDYLDFEHPRADDFWKLIDALLPLVDNTRSVDQLRLLLTNFPNDRKIGALDNILYYLTTPDNPAEAKAVVAKFTNLLSVNPSLKHLAQALIELSINLRAEVIFSELTISSIEGGLLPKVKPNHWNEAYFQKLGLNWIVLSPNYTLIGSFVALLGFHNYHNEGIGILNKILLRRDPELDVNQQLVLLHNLMSPLSRTNNHLLVLLILQKQIAILLTSKARIRSYYFKMGHSILDKLNISKLELVKMKFNSRLAIASIKNMSSSDIQLLLKCILELPHLPPIDKKWTSERSVYNLLENLRSRKGFAFLFLEAIANEGELIIQSKTT